MSGVGLEALAQPARVRALARTKAVTPKARYFVANRRLPDFRMNDFQSHAAPHAPNGGLLKVVRSGDEGFGDEHDSARCAEKHLDGVDQFACVVGRENGDEHGEGVIFVE